MAILNFGSINIDCVYGVDRIVSAGETIDSSSYRVFPGGKGLNQSIAMGRAGADVYHAGAVGDDGIWLIDLLRDNHVRCEHVRVVDEMTGNAFIQVDKNGQNCIVLNGGANRSNTEEFIDETLDRVESGDILLLQNEVNMVSEIIERAYSKGMFIILNPSPMNREVLSCDLRKVSLFIMNEHEGHGLTDEKDADRIIEEMRVRYPSSKTVLTLGAEGSIYMDASQVIRQPSYHVDVVDTTAAGDTFTGYFVAMMTEGFAMRDCLDTASKAAAISVMATGAASSIPALETVHQAMGNFSE
jgi:ribokinase